MTSIKIKLKPFSVPNHVLLELPPRPRQEGLNDLRSVPIKMLDADTLEDMAYDWLQSLYEKAGKRCPFYIAAEADIESGAFAAEQGPTNDE